MGMIQSAQERKERNVASGTIRLNGRFFDASRLKMNKHQLSQLERVSYPTVLKYLGEDDINTFSGDVLYALLVTGMGIAPSELAGLRFGDLFEVVEGETK